MIKILNSKNKRFDFILDKLLSKRKNKVQIGSVPVLKILKDVKKNGDKAIIKYEKIGILSYQAIFFLHFGQ